MLVERWFSTPLDRNGVICAQMRGETAVTSGSSSEQAPKSTRSRARKPATATVEKETKSAAKRTQAQTTRAAKSEAKEKATGTKTPRTVAKPATAKKTRSAAKTTAKSTKTGTTKPARSSAKKKAAVEDVEPTIAQLTSGEIEVEVQRDGDDVVLKVGGKKRSLDEVDDSQFVEEREATLEKELVEEEGFSLSDQDDADEPERIGA